MASASVMSTGMLAWKVRSADREMPLLPPSPLVFPNTAAGAAALSAAADGMTHRDRSSADAVSMDSALPSVLCFFMLFTLLFPLAVYNIRMFSNIYV